MWLQSLQGFALVAIAAIGAWLAWQQVNLARIRLQHDLYDRRFKVYEAAKTFLLQIARNAKATFEEVREFSIAAAEAEFLLDDSVHRYLQEIRKRGADLMGIYVVLPAMPPGADRERAVAKTSEHMLWLVAQLDTLPAKFKPFLTLERQGFRPPWRS